MDRMKDVKAIIRIDCVQDLMRALKDAEVTRFYVSCVHVFGAGVDPKDVRLST